ncbi:MFS general substrate transporter [Microthyrium microscopicum]|uniref:MFS general substrate transporter n=1 Tax=Microthyrium microscopicum TaxID=703497 RepID=A0A6A6USV7_9PEZI|nr:MFS general substrate transporter [Microthyrium microscopicum]
MSTRKESLEASNGAANGEGFDEKPIISQASETSRSQDEQTDAPDGRMTKAKWLACAALVLSYNTSFQQGATIGSIVKSIDEVLGPTTYYNWIVSASTITISVALPLSGGLSDIFGRRYFVLIGCIIGMIAAIVAICAKDTPTIIASSVIAGLGAGSQQIALAAVSELIPNKHRGKAQAILDLSILPWSVFGALMGGAMVTYHGKDGFRINFYIGLALNVICFVLTWFWYHPPSAGLRLGNQTKKQAFAKLDWSGVFLLNSGLLLLLVGISLGGEHAWTSAITLAPLIVGIVELIGFWYWEWKIATMPFMARELFSGKFRTFVLFLVVDFVAGMGLYSAAVFWAQLVRGVWEGNPIEVGLLSLPGGFGGAAGGFLAGMLIGKHKFFKTNHCLIYGTIIKTIADYSLALIQPTGNHSKSFGMGIGFLSMFGTGWTSVSLIVCVQLACLDEDIGMATLILGAVRAVGGSVAVTVYSTLINSTLKNEAGQRIGAAVVPLGYPVKALAPLVTSLINENIIGASQLPGMTHEILSAARFALQQTWTKAFHHVYIASASFSAVSIVAALLTKDVSSNMTNNVAVRLQNDTKKEVTEENGSVVRAP